MRDGGMSRRSSGGRRHMAGRRVLDGRKPQPESAQAQGNCCSSKRRGNQVHGHPLGRRSAARLGNRGEVIPNFGGGRLPD